MSLNLIAVTDQITTQLNLLPQDVYETAAPEDTKLKFDASGNLLPYIVVQYADMFPTSDNGITGAKYDGAKSYMLVSCVAQNERATRQVADAVKNNIVGFQPSDGAIAYSAIETKPNRYVTEIGFTFPVNTVW
jgi:hypothetical protein